MGMSDQYDDGRYDGKVVGMQVYNEKADQWLPGGDPRLPKYRGVELHPRYGLPIQVRRGGIQYPKPKETHMPEPRMTKAQIANKLRLNAELMNTLRRSRTFLLEQERKAIPDEPSHHTMFTVDVRFKMRGTRYQFLILRSGKKYFTTGTKDGQQAFPSWEALCAWLEGPDVYDHTDLEILSSSGGAVSFDTGKIERMDKAQVPF